MSIVEITYTKYVTSDGREFSNLTDASDHENKLQFNECVNEHFKLMRGNIKVYAEGEVFTLGEFLSLRGKNVLTPDDGSRYYVDAYDNSKKFSCSLWETEVPFDATHVVWYSK